MKMDVKNYDDEKFRKYVLANIALEQKLYQRRLNNINRHDSKRNMRLYFQSTRTKYIIGKYLVAAALDVNQLYNCSQIALIIKVSRTAVCSIVKECVEAGWAEEVFINKVKYVRATKLHVETYQDYAWAVLEARNEFVTDYCAAQKLMGNV